MKIRCENLSMLLERQSREGQVDKGHTVESVADCRASSGCRSGRLPCVHLPCLVSGGGGQSSRPSVHSRVEISRWHRREGQGYGCRQEEPPDESVP